MHENKNQKGVWLTAWPPTAADGAQLREGSNSQGF